MYVSQEYFLITGKKAFSKDEQMVMDKFEETSDTAERREFGKTTENIIDEAMNTDISERACEATSILEATPFIPSKMGALHFSTIQPSYQPHLPTGDYQIITYLLLGY